MEDFNREYAKEQFKKLTPDERREFLQSVPVNELLTFLSAEQIQQLRDQLIAGRPPRPRKPGRRK